MNLTLTKIIAYAIVDLPHDRNDTSQTIGYCITQEAALINAKGSDRWNGNCKVQKEEIYINSNGDLYEVKLLGKFMDVDKKLKQKMIDKIKSKLTEEEWKFLENNK